jgi:hypothetical protein
MRYYIGDNQFITSQSKPGNDHILKIAGFNLTDVTTLDVFYNGTVAFIDTVKGPNTDLIFKSIEERKQRGLDSLLIFEYGYESGIGSDDMVTYTKRLKDSNIDKDKVRFILNNSAKLILSDKIESFHGYENIFFIDYFAILSYYRILEGIDVVARKPIWDRKPVLNILLGKLLYKKSRLKALQLLYGKGLAQDAVKGLLISKEHLLEHQKEFQSQQFFRWLLNNLGSADGVPMQLLSDNRTFHSTGSPYDVSIYHNSQVSYVCETSCPETMQNRCFITEKTYRPILNKSPFVLQGDQETLPYLKSLGFDVYDRYTGEYYNENDYDSYIKNTVEASKKLLDSCSKFPKEIDDIAEKNMSLLIEISKRELSVLREGLKTNDTQVSYKWLS